MELSLAVTALAVAPRSAARGGVQHDLVVAHTGLVYSIAKKVHDTFRVPDAIEDLVGYGSVGLLEAAARYRPDSGVPFVSFAYHRVRGAILDGLRRQGWQTRGEYAAQLRLARASAADGADAGAPMAAPVLSVEIAEAAADGGPRLPGEDVLDLRAAVAGLPELVRSVLERYYFADETLPQIAEALGFTKSWTCRLHARGIELLRERPGSKGAAGE
jgi:RNA polymerase sigma factor for flagellar operon FliA